MSHKERVRLLNPLDSALGEAQDAPMHAIRRVGAIIDGVSGAIGRTVDTADRVRLWVAVVGGWRLIAVVIAVELGLLLVVVARLASADLPDAIGPLIAAPVIAVLSIAYTRYRWGRFLTEIEDSPDLEPPPVPGYTASVREYIPNYVRFQVLQRDGFRCRYCGRTPQDRVRLEVDHLHPISKGGTSDPDNLIAACFDCIRSKAARLIVEA